MRDRREPFIARWESLGEPHRRFLMGAYRLANEQQGVDVLRVRRHERAAVREPAAKYAAIASLTVTRGTG